MALKSNGGASTGGQIPPYAPSLSALQELIGAVHTRESGVTCITVGEYEFYIFAVRRPADYVEPVTTPRKTASRRNVSAPSGKAAPEVDVIVAAACRRLRVTRAELVSDSRSRQVVVARALIARHVTKSRVATMRDVARMMNLNYNSMYVSIARYRKLLPELFSMSLENFLNGSPEPSQALLNLMSEQWSSVSPASPIPDAKIAERIASGIPIPVPEPSASETDPAEASSTPACLAFARDR
jgi:hypothetical protein